MERDGGPASLGLQEGASRLTLSRTRGLFLKTVPWHGAAAVDRLRDWRRSAPVVFL